MRIQFTHQTKKMENTTFMRLSISTWLAQLAPPTNPTLDNFTCLFDIEHVKQVYLKDGPTLFLANTFKKIGT